jgi:hypothetical protein
MTKKTMNPKILVHLTISPEIKKWLIDNNVNASELLENATIELINGVGDRLEPQSNDELYNALAQRFKDDNYFTVPYQFEDLALQKEQSVKLITTLRTKYGLDLKSSKEFLERYIADQKRLIFNSDLKKEIEG